MKKLVVSLVVTAALISPAFASAPIIPFSVERNGHVFIGCLSADYADTASVKMRLEELKRWNPKARIEFFALDGAPTDLVRKYRKLVIGEGFRFGTTREPCV